MTSTYLLLSHCIRNLGPIGVHRCPPRTDLDEVIFNNKTVQMC